MKKGVLPSPVIEDMYYKEARTRVKSVYEETENCNVIVGMFRFEP